MSVNREKDRRRQWHPTPVLLPGRSHGLQQPGRLQSTGLLRVRHDWVTSLSLSRVGEGNGNPLQCSCLENPRDGGAWWADVYGVTQSRTQLKLLSSSSSSSILGCGILGYESWINYAILCKGLEYPWIWVSSCLRGSWNWSSTHREGRRMEMPK